MNRLLSFKRLSFLFGATFLVLVGGTVLVQRFWIDPVEKCETSGRWWYAEENRCVTPTYLPNITKRAPGVSRAEASAQQNRERVEIEHRLALEKKARDAEVERQRDALRGR